MKLEVDKNHKKISKPPLKKSLKDITIGVVGVSIAISLYSGALITEAYADDYIPSAYTETIGSNEVKIPDELKYNIASKVGKKTEDPITQEDLSTIEMLFLTINNEDINLDFLKYCSNLKILSLNLTTVNSNILQKIPFNSAIENFMVSSLSVYKLMNEATKDDISAIFKNLPSLKELYLSGMIIEPGCETELNKLECLSLDPNENCDLDFTKLIGLKKLSFKYTEPYDVAIFLNSEEYNTLLSNGVQIEFANEDAKNKYLKASSKLDEIVASLDVNKDSSDQEKLNAILIYVLENLTYNEEVSYAIRHNLDHNELSKAFYTDGALYGALETDSSVCGNYAALVEALMDRLNVPEQSIFMRSEVHAWNLVMIEGEPYYVDATWLDGQHIYIKSEMDEIFEGHSVHTITYTPKKAEEVFEELVKSGQTEEFRWYMENPDAEYIATIDENDNHIPVFVPSYMTLNNSLFQKPSQTELDAEIAPTEINATENTTPISINNDITEENIQLEDISNKKLKIKIGKKEIIITAGALVGVMTGLGVAISVKKKKEQERRRRQAYRYNYSLPYDAHENYDYSGSNGYHR